MTVDSILGLSQTFFTKSHIRPYHLPRLLVKTCRENIRVRRIPRVHIEKSTLNFFVCNIHGQTFCSFVIQLWKGIICLPPFLNIILLGKNAPYNTLRTSQQFDLGPQFTLYHHSLSSWSYYAIFFEWFWGDSISYSYPRPITTWP